MPRTSSSSVQGILGDHYDSEAAPSLDPFIATAGSFVNKVATKNTAGGFGLTDADLELIERWLAAHFYTHSDMIASSKSTGSASGSLQGQTAMHFESSLYGQTAVLLDSTGFLSNLMKESKEGKQKVRLGWTGTKLKDRVRDREEY